MLEMTRDPLFPKDVVFVERTRDRAVADRLVLEGDDRRGQPTTASRLYDAVVNDEGLVGRVSSVSATASQVTLITDQDSFVDSVVLPGGAQGLLAGSVTGDLTLEYVDKEHRVEARPGRRDLGPQRLDLRERDPHRNGQRRRTAGRRALPERLGGARTSTSAPSTSSWW